ncbi:MAG TPA: polysaccharide biosynthesis/export family protein, partial [Terriglobales bacterium]|nr:polysaccharide biosynthesis/export family protein [Terriglobales bacterium]
MTISRSNVRKLRFALTHISAVAALSIGAGAQGQSSQPAQAVTTQNSPQPVSAFDAVTQKPNTPPPDSSLRIGAGDLLEFSVYNVPELATKIRVSSNGDAYLPLIDYVHVADLTVEEAQAVIEKKLSDGGFLRDPHVTLFVDQFASQGVSVLGEVARPAVLPVLGQQRLFDVISAAGGLTDKAGRTVSITHRNQQDKPVIVELTRHLEDSPESNIQVYPGDTIVVRKADIVYVVGDVARPSGFVMERSGLTVLQAVALAGGTTQTAKLNGVQIIRKTETGNIGTPIELKKILQAKAPDVAMQADDILFVPSSVGKMATKRAVEAAVQIATFA